MRLVMEEEGQNENNKLRLRSESEEKEGEEAWNRFRAKIVELITHKQTM